jgi:hypothetical protein
MGEFENEYAFTSFRMPERGSPKTKRDRIIYRTLEECIMSEEDRMIYIQQRPERLATRGAARTRQIVIEEMAQLKGVPYRSGGCYDFRPNTEYHERVSLAEDVYDSGCQMDMSGECAPCTRFETNLCLVLGEITMREQ